MAGIMKGWFDRPTTDASAGLGKMHDRTLTDDYYRRMMERQREQLMQAAGTIRTPNYWERIAARLGVPVSEVHTADFKIAAIEEIEGDKIAVFVIKDRKPIVLETERAMFPNDLLMTQLTMMRD